MKQKYTVEIETKPGNYEENKEFKVAVELTPTEFLTLSQVIYDHLTLTGILPVEPGV